MVSEPYIFEVHTGQIALCSVLFAHAGAGTADIKALYSALRVPDEFEFLLGSGDHDFPTYIRHANYAFLDGVSGCSGSG